jgi:hypothetical protein
VPPAVPERLAAVAAIAGVGRTKDARHG